ncbi:MAG: CHAT domain-containing protein [Bacteroidales bacterium]|nr:CHAT domain-containing protein [Bacteroidales bacterium]
MKISPRFTHVLTLIFTGVCFILFHQQNIQAQTNVKSGTIPDTSFAIKLYQKTSDAADNGRYDSTAFWLAEAIPVFKKSNQWEYQVKSYYLLCGLNYRIRQTDIAGQFLDSALQILTAKTDTSDFLYAAYYHNKATVCYVVGDYREARKLFFKAIDIYNLFPETMNRKIVSSYNNLGLTFVQLTDYENAVIYLEKCLDLNLRYNPENKYLIGKSHNNLGVAYFDKGGSESEKFDFDYFGKQSFQKAEAHYQAAYDNYKMVLSPPNIALGQCCANLATVASARQDHEQCIVYYKQALLNFGEDTDNPFPQVATVYYNAGISFKIIGQLDSARYYLNKAIAMGKSIYGEKHPYLADYYNYLGRVCIVEKKFDEGLTNFQQSLIISCINFDDTVYTHSPDIKQVLFKEEAMRGFAWKALALREKYSMNLDLNDLEMAVTNYYLFNDMVKVILSEFTNEEAKLNFMQSVHENYGDIMELCYQLYTKTDNPKYLEDAIYFSENEKSATLSAFIDNSTAKKNSGMNERELMNEMEAQEKLYTYENEFKNLRLNNVTDSAMIAAASDSLLQSRFRCEKIAMSMGEKYSKYAAWRNDHKKINLADVQAMLSQKNSSSLEYFLMDTAIYIIALNGQDYVFSKVNPDSTFYNMIVDYRRSTSDFQFINEDPEIAYSTFTQSSRALYNTLIPESVKPLIQQFPKIIIIPNGILSYVSFDGLLTTEPEGRNYAALDYLANDNILSYANALRFIESKENNKTPDRNYAGYAPEYDSAGIASGLAGEEFAMFRDNPGLLKEHKAEVRNAGEIFGGDAYIGNDASEWNFKQTAGNYNILHFAMHAQINDENPLSSKFLFSQHTDNNNEDNFLNTYEIYNLNLNARLVVLSACNTAGGILRKGEGVMSLSRAFMYSGVSSIVSSLWLAEDHAANKIMSGFFEGINDGLPIDEALHLSRNRYLASADPVFSHPYFWANFIVMGNNDPVQPIRMFPLKTATFIALFIMMALGLFYFFYGRKVKRVRI